MIFRVRLQILYTDLDPAPIPPRYESILSLKVKTLLRQIATTKVR